MNPIVKALGLSSVIIFSGAAQADWDANWLIGASAGYGTRSGDLNVNVTDVLVDDEFSTTSRSFSQNGWLWGLLAGYQARCNCWLVGGEVSVDWMDHGGQNNYAYTDADDTWVGSASFDSDALVAVSMRLGYEVASFFLPYIRLGVETSRDKLDFSVANFDNTLAASGEGQRRSYRFLGGVGMEFPVPMCEGLSLRAEYNYHSRGRSVSAGATANDGLTYVSADTKQHANTGKASLVWNFPA